MIPEKQGATVRRCFDSLQHFVLQTAAMLRRALIVLPALTGARAATVGWSQFGGGPSHASRACSVNGPVSQPQAAWSFAMAECKSRNAQCGASPVVSADGFAVYIGDGGGQVYRLAATNGALVWTWQGEQISENAVAVSAALDEVSGQLVVTPVNGYIAALNTTTGAQSYYYAVDGGLFLPASPSLLPGVAAAVVDGPALHGLNLTSHRTVFGYSGDGDAQAAAAQAADGSVVYAALGDYSNDGALPFIVAVNATDSSRLWGVNLNRGDSVGTSLVLARGDSLLLASTAQTLLSIDAATGAVLSNVTWASVNASGRPLSAPAIDCADASAFTLDDAGVLRAWAIGPTGSLSLSWASTGPTPSKQGVPVASSPIVDASGHVYVLRSLDTVVYAVDAATGGLLWTVALGADSGAQYFSAPSPSAVLGPDGTLYATGTNGTLFALRA
jgi:outer membrane protein assembly factor BamB